MVFDCSDEASFDCVIPQIVDPGNLDRQCRRPAEQEIGHAAFLGHYEEWRPGVAR